MTGVFLVLDQFFRFYQGHWIAYLPVGFNGWIPSDRSWTYGYLVRWLLERAWHASTLIVLQAACAWIAIAVAARSLVKALTFPSTLSLVACGSALDSLIRSYVSSWLTTEWTAK